MEWLQGYVGKVGKVRSLITDPVQHRVRPLKLIYRVLPEFVILSATHSDTCEFSPMALCILQLVENRKQSRAPPNHLIPRAPNSRSKGSEAPYQIPILVRWLFLKE